MSIKKEELERVVFFRKRTFVRLKELEAKGSRISRKEKLELEMCRGDMKRANDYLEKHSEDSK